MTHRPSRRVLLLLCLLPLLAVGSALAASNGDTAQHRRTPTTLWDAFPLEPRPQAAGRAAPNLQNRAASRQTSPGEQRDPNSWLVVFVLAVLILVAGTFAVRPRFAPALVTSFRRGTRIRDGDARSDDLLEALRPVPPRRREPVSAEICDIRLWRGYIKAQLYAVARSGGTIATSRYFRLARTEDPTSDALSALSELRAELEARGWAISVGSHWYEKQPIVVNPPTSRPRSSVWWKGRTRV
jgi:hypothetical protein